MHSLALSGSRRTTPPSPRAPARWRAWARLRRAQLLIGVDKDAFPMSYIDENGATPASTWTRPTPSASAWAGRRSSSPSRVRTPSWSSPAGNVDVAWGGLSLTLGEGEDYVISEPYMSNSVLVVTRASSDVRSMRGLSGASLAVDVEQKYIDAVLANEDLMERPDQIKRVTGGAQALFTELNNAQVDAIVVYKRGVAILRQVRYEGDFVPS